MEHVHTSYQLAVKKQPEYLHIQIQCFEVLNTQIAKEIVKRVCKELESHDYFKVLLAAKNYYLSLLDLYALIYAINEYNFLGKQIAFLIGETRLSKDTEVFEQAAINRGVKLKFFSYFDEANLWLTDNL